MVLTHTVFQTHGLRNRFSACACMCEKVQNFVREAMEEPSAHRLVILGKSGKGVSVGLAVTAQYWL
eukprot:567003-Amphidinium_carterae.2